VPGCQDGRDLFGFGVSWGTAGNAGGDQDPAELGEHVLEGGPGLGGVPGFGGAAGGDAGGVVAVAGVPGDDQGVDEQGERDGALDGAAGPGAGLAGAEDVAGIGEGLLDGLITNGKFCCVRRVRLSLSWWHRRLRLRGSVLRSDVALAGEPDEPDVDHLPPARPVSRRRAPVGSGLPAAGPVGRAGQPAGSGTDRRGGA
jgi:hypothetical protein